MRCDFKICLDSQTIGVKATWEFFRHAAQPSDGVCWRMFEYNLKTKECETARKPQVSFRNSKTSVRHAFSSVYMLQSKLLTFKMLKIIAEL